MKILAFLLALVALAAAQAIPPTYPVQTKPVDADFVARQTKVLLLLENIGQVQKDADWYKIGYEYNIEANLKNYTNNSAVEQFLVFYKSGFMPKHKTFTVFYDRMRDEAIALFKLFFFAKDFDTFYKTAAYARVYFNEGQFLYAFYIAVYQRQDTQSLVLPAPYEMFPQYFVNTDTFLKAYRTKMQNGILDPTYAKQLGIVKENNYYVYYSNYSSPGFTGSEEQKLAYFTEDIGMNSFYYFFQSLYPFWFSEGEFDSIKQFRGELIYFTYKQLIAQYYLHRLSNGLGEIPEFSWDKPIKTGYTCQLSTYYPFFQRNDYYPINKNENEEYIKLLKGFESSFLNYLKQGHFNAYNQEVDFNNSQALNFVGNYWFTNVNLYENSTRNYESYYEITARHLLAGTPEPVDKYTVIPSALELYQTSLRDPVFYQFYAYVLNYIMQYNENLTPYTDSQLQFPGVTVNDVNVDELTTFFDFFDFDITNDIFYSVDEFQSDSEVRFRVRQPRLFFQPFTVTVDVESNVATEAIVKLFMGPQFDSTGSPSRIENNWMNFVELDWFHYNLTVGQNKIERTSNDFIFYKEDSIPVSSVLKMLDQGKVPLDMSENFFYTPNRMMLPKGTKGGFPFQLYVVVYPYTPLPKEKAAYAKYIPDNKPFSYPFDRPVNGTYFKQPNFFYKDVSIYHKGEEYANDYKVKGYNSVSNVVPL